MIPLYASFLTVKVICCECDSGRLDGQKKSQLHYTLDLDLDRALHCLIKHILVFSHSGALAFDDNACGRRFAMLDAG